MVRKARIAVAVLVIVSTVVLFGILSSILTQKPRTVPHEGTYGIYTLDLATNEVALIYSTNNEVYTSALRLNTVGDTLVFAQKIDGSNDNNTEIFTIGVDGKNLKRITNNSFWDLYPAWSPDDTQIAFLSKREKDLDIYVTNTDGNNQRKLYDSGSNDADIDWVGDTIVFTSMFKIWRIKDDGTSPTQITNLSNAGQWGTANLPVGDYDPRLRSDGAKIVFERLEDPNSTHGNYNIFTINVDGTGETRLTSTGYAQGLANWSHDGDRIVYVVAAINNEGKYDIYVMNADGTNNHNATPSYFPTNFLCHSPVFSKDDSKIYFIGQWS
jgi:Tol biopolymer transport system component